MNYRTTKPAANGRPRPAPRQFFFAPVVLPRYNRHTGQAFRVGAASHKVGGLAAGVRTQAKPALIVSSPIVTASRAQRYFSGFVCHDQRLACAYLPALSLRGLNRLFAAFAYLLFAMRHVRPCDGVVLYNYFPEYVLAAAFLRWRLGRDKVMMDIEDGPRADEKTLRGYISRMSLRLLTQLCSRRAIVVSHHLAEIMRIDQACVVNGVSPDIDPAPASFATPVTFLYGGSIETGSGLDLFAGALRELVRTHAGLVAQMHFVVTGFGGGAELHALTQELAATGLTLEVRQHIGPDEYRRILASADVGLSLKLPDSALSATTFPSKVIELASHGLLVLTTDISDISLLFDGDTAAVLPRAEPAALASLCAAITTDPERYRRIAAAGQQRIAERCSQRSVGRRLVAFLGLQTAPSAM